MQINARVPGLYLAVLLAVISGGSSWGPKTEELIVVKAHELVAQARGEGRKTEARKLRVIVFGAHPDDPETGCGGPDRSPDERRPCSDRCLRHLFSG